MIADRGDTSCCDETMPFGSSSASSFRSLSRRASPLSVWVLSSLSENGNSPLMNQLFHGFLLVCLRRNAYFEMWDKPRIQPRRTADFIGSSVERAIGRSRSA
jgi:hypothetical protein